jgi:hypothetical protein
MRQINRNLKKNRRILSSLLSARQSARVHINQLQEQGFVFGYFTHVQATRTGLLYFYCYDLGYAKSCNEQLMIRRGMKGKNSKMGEVPGFANHLNTGS